MIIMNMNTSYYDKGNIITCRKKIAWNYFKLDFIFDMLSLIPFFTSFIFNINNSTPIEACIFFRFFSLKRQFSKIFT